MKIKVTDAKIKKLEENCEVTRKLLQKMEVHSGCTDADVEHDKVTRPLRTKVGEVLDEVQKRASVRRLSIFSIEAAADKAEDMLDELNVPSKLRKGCRFTVFGGGGDIPRSYKYNFDTSAAIIERGSGNRAWFLIEASRETFSAGNGAHDNLVITPKARKHLVRSRHMELTGEIRSTTSLP